MRMSPFSAPFFWGTQKRGLLLPKRAAALWEGTQWCKGGTGKISRATNRHSSHNGARFKWLLRFAAVTSGWPTNRKLTSTTDEATLSSPPILFPASFLQKRGPVQHDIRSVQGGVRF